MVFSWAKLAFFSFIVRKTTFVLFLLLNYPVLSFFAQKTCFRSFVATLRRFQSFCGNILFLFLLKLRCFQLYLTVNNVFGFFFVNWAVFGFFHRKYVFVSFDAKVGCFELYLMQNKVFVCLLLIWAVFTFMSLIHHFTGLFRTTIIISSQLAC